MITLSPFDTELIAAIREHVSPAVLGVTRLIACFAWIPYLSSGAIPSRLVRMILALIVMIGMWPVTESVARPSDTLGLLFALFSEALIGTMLGLMLALPYHVFHALGSIIDSQRGASVGAMLDPLSGVEATELANLLQMFSAVVFLVAGGLVPLLEAVQASYTLIPMGTRVVPELGSVHSFVDVMLSAAMRMAAPVLLLLFLVEIVLGVLSRFAQQMNAFSVSLAVKSFLAFLAMLFYLMLVMTDQVPVLWRTYSPLRVLLPEVVP